LRLYQQWLITSIYTNTNELCLLAVIIVTHTDVVDYWQMLEASNGGRFAQWTYTGVSKMNSHRK